MARKISAAGSAALQHDRCRLDERLGPMRQESASRILLMLKKSLYLASRPAKRGVLRSSHVSVPAVGPSFGGVRRKSSLPTPAREPLELALEQWLARCAVRSRAFGPVLCGFSEVSLAAAIRYRPTNQRRYRAFLQRRSAEILPICRRLLGAAILRQSRREPPAYLAEITQ